MTGWTALLELTRTLLRAPSFALFTDLLTGWVCAPGRRTITAMIAVGDPAGVRAHDAYHRFIRDGAWAMSGLWRMLAVRAVARFAPAGVVVLDCDDTLFHKSGRKVEGAGVFRDAVRSTTRRVVYALGLNLVVITLRVKAPWGGCPIALPVNARLHRNKGATSTVEHAAAMLQELAGWLPGRQFHLCADGAYASLASMHLPRTHAQTATRYAGRWSIEVTFRDAKQDVGGENPRCWKRKGPRTRRLPVTVAARHHLVLVHRHPPRGPHLARPTLVPPQAHPQLPRRPRRATPRPMGTTNYRNVRINSPHRQNHRQRPRRAGLRHITPSGTAKLH